MLTTSMISEKSPQDSDAEGIDLEKGLDARHGDGGSSSGEEKHGAHSCVIDELDHAVGKDEEEEDAIASRISKGGAWARFLTRFTTHGLEDPGPAPDGGLKALAQVGAAWLVVVTTWGYMNSFGVFQTYYTSILAESPSTISWIGSLQLWVVFFISTVSGRALDGGLFIPCFVVGSIIQLLGIFCNSFCRTFWQLILAQGLCTGLGSGIIFCPTMGLVTTYFTRRRGMAVAIVSTGNSFGGAVYPIMVRQLLPQIGFGWTVRVIGFINLVCLLVAVAVMRPRLPPRKSGALVDWAAFKELPYALSVVAFTLVFGALFFVYYYVASYSTAVLHMSYSDAATLVILFNVIGIPARLITGALADRFTGPINAMIPLILVNAVCAFSWIGVRSRGGLYALTSVYGLAAGAFQCLFPTAITSLNRDLTKNGIRLGMAFTVFSFGGLTGPPIGGAIITSHGGGRAGYAAAFLGVGIATTAGTALLYIARGYKIGWQLWVKC